MNESVSAVEYRKAEERIQRKLDALKRWVRKIPWRAHDDGSLIRNIDGDPILEYFPRSPSAFAAWDGTQNSKFVRITDELDFKSMSRDTVNRHEHAKAELLAVLDSLTKRANRQLLRANKSTLIARLLAERSWYRKYVLQQETEIAVLIDQLTMAREALESEATTRACNERELQGRIEDLEKRNAQLVASLGKVSSLHQKKVRQL